MRVGDRVRCTHTCEGANCAFPAGELGTVVDVGDRRLPQFRGRGGEHCIRVRFDGHKRVSVIRPRELELVGAEGGW
jgi:hypothetical protein